MLTPSELRRQLQQIRDDNAVATKKGQQVDTDAMIGKIWPALIEDFGKFSDQRTRNLIKILREFKL